MWLGLKINYEKSNIIFLGDMDMSGLIVKKILGCTFLIKYLGVPISHNWFKKDD